MSTRASNQRHLRVGLTLALMCAALVAIGHGPRPTWAQFGGGYDLTWSTVDGGGGTWSTGGGFSLGGAAGQPDAGLSVGGDYALAGGFWSGGAVPRRPLYLPLVVR
jgi:hypothetical protein